MILLLAGVGTAILALAGIAIVARAALDEFGRARVPCLLYHQLQPPKGAGAATDVDPVYVCYADRFAAQMDYLSQAGYTTLTLDALMQGRRDARLLPARPVLVTFDDGFASVYRLAFPVLRRNRQSATIFMTPDRASPNFQAYAHLDRPLSDDELRELSRSDIDIQSHGLTHRLLTELDDAELRRELEEPRVVLERTTGRLVRYLAIPSGAYDSRVRAAARRAGYEAVFCMRKGSVGPRTDPYALPRMVVSRDMSLDDFRSLLGPAGWFRGRIISFAQEAVSRLLGMRRTDRLRDRLYRSPLSFLLRPRILVWVVVGAVAAVVSALALLLAFAPG